MERIITRTAGAEIVNTVSYGEVAAFEQEVIKTEELSCNQLLKNLLITNLKLLKLNEISSVLLF